MAGVFVQDAHGLAICGQVLHEVHHAEHTTGCSCLALLLLIVGAICRMMGPACDGCQLAAYAWFLQTVKWWDRMLTSSSLHTHQWFQTGNAPGPETCHPLSTKPIEMLTQNWEPAAMNRRTTTATKTHENHMKVQGCSTVSANSSLL